MSSIRVTLVAQPSFGLIHGSPNKPSLNAAISFASPLNYEHDINNLNARPKNLFRVYEDNTRIVMFKSS